MSHNSYYNNNFPTMEIKWVQKKNSNIIATIHGCNQLIVRIVIKKKANGESNRNGVKQILDM